MKYSSVLRPNSPLDFIIINRLIFQGFSPFPVFFPLLWYSSEFPLFLADSKKSSYFFWVFQRTQEARQWTPVGFPSSCVFTWYRTLCRTDSVRTKTPHSSQLLETLFPSEEECKTSLKKDAWDWVLQSQIEHFLKPVCTQDIHSLRIPCLEVSALIRSWSSQFSMPTSELFLIDSFIN